MQNLDELQQSKDELKSQNSDLHTQLRLSRVRGKQPLSSTPYRPSAPSWHEELMEQESLTSTNSPILPRHIGAEGVANGVNGEVELEEEEESLGVSASDSFTKILEETVSCKRGQRDGKDGGREKEELEREALSLSLPLSLSHLSL